MAAYINRQTNRELSHAHYCMVAGELSLPQNRPDQANLKQPIVLINKNLISPTMPVIREPVYLANLGVSVKKLIALLHYAILASLWSKKWGYLFPSPFSLPFPLSLPFLLPSTPLPFPSLSQIPQQ